MQLQKNNTTFKTKGRFNTRLDVIICVLLIVATLGVYWQIKTQDFIGYDDDNYINCGSAFFAQGKMVEAIAHFKVALQIKPDLADARTNLENLSAYIRADIKKNINIDLK